MSEKPLRVVFAGTPEFAALHLAALVDAGLRPVAVYTQPDRPAGRGKKLQASPVKTLALQHGLPIRQPASLKNEQELRALTELEADILVVVAYGLILPQAILDTPRHGCLNVHASLLPRWRGAAPIQRAIEAGDERTGITIMQMDAGLDTGDMLATASCPVTPQTNAASLHDELAALGPALLLKVLSQLSQFQAAATVQPDDGTTYAAKILKQEAAIDWQQDAHSLDRQIRAFNPFPVCFTMLGQERLKIWQASIVSDDKGERPVGSILEASANGILVQCGQGRLCITRLQLPGGKAMPVAQMLNARAADFAPGIRLGNPEQAS